MCKRVFDVPTFCYGVAVAIDRSDAEERAARIGTLLDELHLNAEDLTELAKQAVRRALQTVQQARAEVARAPAVPASKKR